ncbi:DEAD/DEAH box helicase family protein [Priestia sp. Y58]|uniref:DEAD/DEAH box helicase family protein n=1 Tax=Priestia sp. Y58 TaxID=2922804 RepID=UPI0024058643|nr:helicase C-terminal domain-containing protein [Priestia sp. Y58]MDG0029969.1 DEAD/DEAH box helicase family protein [Priestia sp. Y58]
MVNFLDLFDDNDQQKAIFPKEIFESTVRDNQSKFSYLRGDQEKVLEKWFEQRQNKDSIIKMNTGGGKTTVGLLQLQSSINEGVGPALYLCLDNQLVEQVLNDAKHLGINAMPFGKQGIPPEFLNSEAILVTTFQRLFNAKSAFGIQGDASKPVIDVGTVVIDDAHAALNKARDVFTLRFPSTNVVYTSLVTMFKESLLSQSMGTAMDVIEGRDRFGIITVPYWSWKERIKEVTELLSKAVKDNEGMVFKWPVVRDYLEHYHVFISSQSIEISPKCLPIQKIPSYYRAKRRIFMSATLNDDSSLIRDMQVDKKAILSSIESDTFSDIGEKMILAPYNIDKTLKTDLIATAFGAITKYNVVTIVSSHRRAELWKKNNFVQPQPEEITDVINKLKKSNGNHIVFSNRYDGIDLPGDACRILIIDDLPVSTSLLEQHSLYSRPNSKIMRMTQAQKIEQGLGRAVRSVNDYAVILLVGSELVSTISTNEFQSLMSPQTVTQINLGTQVAGLVKKEGGGEPINLLVKTMVQALKRDENWVKLHKQRITKTKKPSRYVSLIDLAERERNAFDLALARQDNRAAEQIRSILNEITDLVQDDEGWYLQLAASYMYNSDRAKAIELQLSAHSKNSYLLRPPSGTTYVKLLKKQTKQSIKVQEFIKRFIEPNAITLHMTQILDNLMFEPNSSSAFERAFAELGKCLGFETQQPEQAYGVGSDILWNIYEDEFLIIEAKNEVKKSRTEIYKSEAEQISNSMNWFNTEYSDKVGTPILIHPANKSHREAFAPEETLVLNDYNLNALKENVKGFFVKISERNPSDWTPQQILSELKNYKLERSQIKKYFVMIQK